MSVCVETVQKCDMGDGKHYCAVGFCQLGNLECPEKRTSDEDLPLLNWPLSESMGHFLD